MSAPTLYDVPLLCSECDGEGGAWFVRCGHMGACPCPPRPEDCPRCEGTGEEPCDYCPDSPAVRRTEDGDVVCGHCYREVVLGVEDHPDRAGHRDPSPAQPAPFGESNRPVPSRSQT